MAKEANPIEVEDFNGDWSKYSEWFDNLLAKYQTNKDPDAKDLTGSLLRWQRADGYAYYVVTKHSPLTVANLPIGDAWQVEPALIRGLRAEDVREQLRRDETMAKLFKKKK